MKFEFEIYMKRLEIEMENCMNGNRKTVKLIVWGPSRNIYGNIYGNICGNIYGKLHEWELQNSQTDRLGPE